MKAFFSDHAVLTLPAGHRFPISKYHLLRQRVLESGLFAPGDLLPAEPATDEQLLRVHTPEYLEKVKTGALSEREQRRIGSPWSPGLLARSLRSVGGTIAASRAALQAGLAANLAGGTHHAYPDHGEGYCVFNDVAVAARAVQAEGLARRVLIIDLDVHQGNGTAFIFQADPTVFTFSVHGEKNFPFHKETGDLDIALPDASGDSAYLEAVQRGLDEATRRAHADFAIYLAGADPFAGDQLGRLAVSKPALAERDRLVFATCRRLGLPLVLTMAGGYARDIHDSVDIQFRTVELACAFSQNGGRP